MENSTTKFFYNTIIPSDWEVKRLGDICSTFKSGNGITSEDINEAGKYAVYGGNGLRGYTNRYTHEGNYFLIGRQGALCGNIVRVYGKNYISEHAIAVQTDTENDNLFLAYKLEFQNLNRLSESSAQPGLSVEKLVRLKIALPPLPEQCAIAHVLSLMDSAINQNNQLIIQKDLRKKWLMQNLLTGKKRLKGFGGEWKKYRIEELFDKVYRYVEWDDRSIYKLVSVRRRFGGLFERGDFFGRQIEVKKIKSIYHNDFLISKRQVSHGAWGIVSPEFHDRKVSDEYDCLIIKDDEKLFIEFWDWYSQMPLMRHHAFLASNGVHIEKLIFDFDTFKRRRVLIPFSVEEQTAMPRCCKRLIKKYNCSKPKPINCESRKRG